VVQIVSLRLNEAPTGPTILGLEPKPGDWENMLIQICSLWHPIIRWPPKVSFTNGGQRGYAYLMDRWRRGNLQDRITHNQEWRLRSAAAGRAATSPRLSSAVRRAGRELRSVPRHKKPQAHPNASRAGTGPEGTCSSTSRSAHKRSIPSMLWPTARDGFSGRHWRRL
jgi:hypothetical protein